MTRKRKSKATQKVTSQRDLSKRLNVSRSTINRLREDGLARDAAGGYDLAQAEELLRRRTLRVAHMGNGTAQVGLAAKTRKMVADAERAELELARAKQAVVERVVVTREWNCHVLAVKNRFLGLGRELAPRLAGCGPMQIQAAIDGRVFEILRMLANQKYYPIETLEQDLNLGTSPSN
jgi:biotin operon repressor